MGSIGMTHRSGSGFNQQQFNSRMEQYIGGGYAIGGEGGIFDQTELQYIRNNMENTSSSMYRLEENSYTAKDLKIGDTINFNNEMKSFAKSEQVMGRLLQDAEDWGGFDEPVIFRTTGNIKYFDVQKHAQAIGNTYYDYQQETFLDGKNWKIKNISFRQINGTRVKIVTIGQ